VISLAFARVRTDFSFMATEANLFFPGLRAHCMKRRLKAWKMNIKLRRHP
jgi:hypothetical protein